MILTESIGPILKFGGNITNKYIKIYTKSQIRVYI